MTAGFVVAAPASGSGKTVLTLALLRAFARRGVRVASFKVGPDYIDPAYHAAASGRPCRNLDLWAMRPETFAAAARDSADGAELLIGEGVMGLFDGAEDETGSTADVACRLGLPVVLAVNARGQAASAAALLRGFRDHRPALPVAGVVFTRVGGDRHRRSLRRAGAAAMPVLGLVPRDERLILPRRHLGLVQAMEHPGLDRFLDAAAALVERHVDLEAVMRLAAAPVEQAVPPRRPAIPPLGRRIAVARDRAFAFAYPSLLEGWRRAGARLLEFSPLADQAPDPGADAVYLPGGYPELHAARLAAGRGFLPGLRAAAERGAALFGECGGYMVLGEALIDGDGRRHAMAGLLPLVSAFDEPRLHLGYRRCTLGVDTPLGSAGRRFRGHEFHYARTLAAGGEALFRATDAGGRDLGPAGIARGSVAGSFLHLIDEEGA